MLSTQVFSRVRSAFVLSALPVTLIAVVPAQALAANLKYDQLYVFGDSLSDTGNVRDQTFGLFPQSPPYYQGRFSNGPVWVEELGNKLGLTPTRYTQGFPGNSPSEGVNFAFGGATTGNNNVVNIPFLPLPGLQTEIDYFKNGLATSGKSANPDALYVVWAGGNDYLLGGATNPTQPVVNLATALTSLFNLGARNFLVPNLPDLGNTPVGLSRGSDVSNGLNQLSVGHNAGLAQTVNNLSQSLTGINLISVDVNSLFDSAIANPSQYGFTNVTQPCLTNFQNPVDFIYNVCARPNEYLFWDEFHPTTAGHKLVAESAYLALSSKSVPEPTASFAILAFGALGAVSGFKQKRQKTSPVKSHAKLY